MTELNFTFYRQPQAGSIKKMTAQTSNTFVFSVKAHQSMTHFVNKMTINDDVDTFKKGIEPLCESGQLSAVVLQFPFSFYYTNDNRRYLDMLCESLRSYPLAVEFRNAAWQKQSVYNEFLERKIAMVNVDEPRLEKLLAPTQVISAPRGYIRFHGRNAAQWWNGDNVSRYDYLYNDNELSEWIPRIRAMAARAEIILIAFNNHSRGQAIKNARRLKEMLGLLQEKGF